MKRMVALLLALMMCFSLAACGGNGGNNAPATDNGGNNATPPADNTGTDTPAADGETYSIGVAIYKYDDNFMTLYRQDIQAYFEIGRAHV